MRHFFVNLFQKLNAKENIELPLLIGNNKVNGSYVEELIQFLGLKDGENYQKVIMITHNMDLAKEADRMIRIVDGIATCED
ncbi:hypothetical protein lbkm_0080 [Lachnospiraceae bacterium KM106-2]|nr:hypothetical protein lbkm_0080 [Lachnospiraceae bacterium KM106-2]